MLSDSSGKHSRPKERGIPINTFISRQSYVRELYKIAELEGVHWFIPASHASHAVADAQLKDQLVSNLRIHCLSMDAEITSMLDDKMLFMFECRRLCLSVPLCEQVRSLEEVIQFARHGLFDRKHFFMKVRIFMQSFILQFHQVIFVF